MTEQIKQQKTKIHTVYKTQEGLRVPSVTTILGILDKPALLYWAWQCGCDGIDYRKVRDTAADIGTLAHYLILCDIKGKETDVSEYSQQDIDKAETCLLKYWEWRKGHDFKPILAEMPLVSERYQFGGTIDCLAELDGALVLIDHKTGKGIYEEMFYQLAGYQQLLLENGHAIQSARILRIGRDENEGFEEQQVVNLDRHWELFLHCLAIYNLRKEIKKGV